MKDGICPRCQSENVYSQIDGIGFSAGKGIFLGNGFLPMRPRLISFVCTNCGLLETYIDDPKAIEKIQKEWDKVPMKQ